MNRLLFQTMLFLLIALTATTFAPTTRAQWTTTNGPFGATISDLHSSLGILLATSQAGIFRSTDNGDTWHHAYKGTGEFPLMRAGGRLYSSDYKGLLFSDDDGTTWQYAATDLPEGSISALAYDGLYYAGGASIMGLYVSATTSAWQRISDGLPNSYVVSIVTTDSSVLASLGSSFGGDDGGVFKRSKDGSWTRVLASIEGYRLFNVGSALFAASWSALYRSTDDGATWQPATMPIQESFVLSIIATPDGLYASTNNKGIYRSTDNGATWSSAGMQFAGVVSLVQQSGDLFAGTIQHGVFVLRSGSVQWQPINNGIQSTTTIPVLAADHANTSLYAIAEGMPFLSKGINRGTAWQSLNLPPSTTTTVTALSVVGETLLAGTNSEGIYTADLNTAMWQKSSGIEQTVWVTSFLHSGSTILAGTFSLSVPPLPSGGIILSTDKGASWSKTQVPGPVYALAQHKGELYAGSARTVVKSLDNGQTWTATSAAPVAESDIYALASNGSALFASAYNDGVFVSTDNGATWTQSIVSSPPASIRVQSFAVYEHAVFAATQHGVLRTTDNGQTWEPVNEGFEQNQPIQSLAVLGSDLYAGTAGSAVWLRPLSELVTTSVPEATLHTTAFELFPNPVKSTAVLRVHTQLRNASLVVSTLTGQRVQATTGLHGADIQLQRRDLAPGTYVFTVEENGVVIASGTFMAE